MNTAARGYQRFDYFLNQLQEIFSKAKQTDNIGLSVYQQGARTPLFMLEALSRIYLKSLSDDPFKKLRQHFKSIEDQLGAVDYYDGFRKEFSENQSIPQEIRDFISKRMDEELAKLNSLLTEEGWTDAANNRIVKTYNKLNEVAWPTDENDSEGIKNYYTSSINKIAGKVADGEIAFKDVENDVHELRREIRWLSIYPHSLRGIIQLKPSSETPDYIQKYLTQSVLNSPYNKMPDIGNLENPIYLDANHFYAMSWLIATLGDLKDNGLRIEVIAEAISASDTELDKTHAEAKAFSICGDNQMSLEFILNKSKEISTTFFNEQVLQKLPAW